jgi:hypothetical protein
MSVKVYNAAGEEKINEAGFAPQGVVMSAFLPANAAAASGWRKIALSAKEFDPFAWFDTTNNRFQPKIAGYYRIPTTARVDSLTAGQQFAVALYKNGAEIRRIFDGAPATGSTWMAGSGSPSPMV